MSYFWENKVIQLKRLGLSDSGHCLTAVTVQSTSQRRTDECKAVCRVFSYSQKRIQCTIINNLLCLHKYV